MRLVHESSRWRMLGPRRIVSVVGFALVVMGVITLLSRPLDLGILPDGTGPGADDRLQPTVTAPSEVATVVPGDGPVEAAVAASAALYDEAPLVLLAGEGDVDGQARGSSVAVALGAPLLLVPEAGTDAGDDDSGTGDDAAQAAGLAALDEELGRLDPEAVLTVGEPATAWAQTWDGSPVVPAPADDADLAALTGQVLGLRPPAGGGTDDPNGGQRPRPVGDPQAVAAEELVDAVAALERDAPALLTVDAEPRAPRAEARSPAAERSPTAPPEAERRPNQMATAAGDPATVGALTERRSTAPAAALRPPDVAATAEALPTVAPADPLDAVLVLLPQDPAGVAAAATARASGARLALATHADPRVDGDVRDAVAGDAVERVVAIGEEFGPPEQLRQRLAVAQTGVELPGGGQALFPGRLFVALYGHPDVPALGVLGEQPRDEAIARAKERAAQYEPLADEPVVPTLEIITTVASSSPGPDGDYSNKAPVELIRPWVVAARAADVYVVLDLQPGRSDFLSQAKLYEELLAEPHVGLALDPEWRLEPDQQHLDQIGSVSADEVNEVIDWLAELTRKRNLPQKLLVLHQFRQAMITDREQVDTGQDELAVLIHADGFGTPTQKLDTWDALQTDPPPVVWWGWKNFIDEDSPTFTPAQTLDVDPTPRFISYQ